MKEFLLNNYHTITHFVEFLAAITGLLFFRKYNQSAAKYFIWFLVYIALIEFLGSYSRYIDDYKFLAFLNETKFRTSHWWATVFWNIGGTLFFSFYYIKILKNKAFKSIVKIACLLFFITSIVSIIINWNSFFSQYSPLITIFGASVVILSISLYFVEILQDEKIIMFYKSINFVISSILLLWMMVTTPLVLYNLYYSTADWNFVFLRWQIFLFMNMIMYITFTFAFIFCKPEHE